MARRPVNQPYTITKLFGVRDTFSRFGYHTGVDYSKVTGSGVFAPKSGTVTQVSYSVFNGKVVQIFDGKYYHRMLHNSKILVKVGQKVKEGDKVALSGSTGLSTGPHVHWDICVKQTPTAFSQFVSPGKWLSSN